MRGLGWTGALCLATMGTMSCGNGSAPVLNEAPRVSRAALSTDSSVYNFETGLQGWVSNIPAVATLSWVDSNAYIGPTYLGSGSARLDIKENVDSFAGLSIKNFAGAPALTAGTVITMRIWMPTQPAGSYISDLHPYIKYNTNNCTADGAPGGASTSCFYDFYVYSGSALPADSWVTAYLVVPPDAVGSAPVAELGVGTHTNGCSGPNCGPAYTGTIYIDSVDW